MPMDHEHQDSGDEGDYCKDSVFASPHVNDLTKARRVSRRQGAGQLERRPAPQSDGGIAVTAGEEKNNLAAR